MRISNEVKYVEAAASKKMRAHSAVLRCLHRVGSCVCFDRMPPNTFSLQRRSAIGKLGAIGRDYDTGEAYRNRVARIELCAPFSAVRKACRMI